MTRDEFKTHAIKMFCNGHDGWKAGILNDLEPFWSPEFRDGWKASVFLVTKVIIRNLSKKDTHFWNWCKENLSKVPMCFMSDVDNDIEWWGFNNEQDAVLFSLRWA